VDGLLSSAPVYIKGYKAGKVMEVKYDAENDDFIVTCSIMKEFRIPEDSRMTIYGVDIMGGKGIRIDLGQTDLYASNGDVLAPATEPALLDGLTEGIAPVIAKVENTLDSLTAVAASVNALLKDGTIRNTLAHLERTTESVERVASVIDGKSDELNSFIDDLGELAISLNGIADKADVLVGNVSDIVASVDPSVIEDVISSFNSVLAKIDDKDGSVGRLLTDDSIYSSVDELLNDIDTLVRKIQENPKKYIKISVF
jgi:phospholipid/cholesterol/gamma-HCH transport system substrate-binding protein